MIKKVLPIFLLLFSMIIVASPEGKIPARVKTEVIKLKYITVSNQIAEIIKSIVDDDYSGKATFVYDHKTNSILITATNVTIERVKRFLNKIDVKTQNSAILTVYLLKEKNGKSDPIPPILMKKIKKLGINNVAVVSKAFVTVSNQSETSVIIKDKENGSMYKISLFANFKGISISLNPFTIWQLLPEKNNRDFLRKLLIVQSPYTITEEDPLVIGVTSDSEIDYLFGIMVSM